MLFNRKKRFYFSDCAVNEKIDSSTLLDITNNSIDKVLLFEKQVVGAILSYSSKKNKDQGVNYVLDKIWNQKKENVFFDGELQFDSAFDLKVREKKGADNILKDKQINLFVFTSLEAANISYKIFSRVGKYKALGPMVLGVKKPFSDLSRGASRKEIYLTSLLTIRETIL